jgi:NAD-reducing hydrogenase small subunit
MRWCTSITSCPAARPRADAIWAFLTDLIAGRTPHLGHGLMHYD